MEEDITLRPVEEASGTPLLERCARLLSALFNPFIIPMAGFLLLFFCTYLRILPLSYSLTVLGIVFCFTIVTPLIAIWLFQLVNGRGLKELSERKKRFIPYLLTILSYMACLITMNRIHLPHYMTGIITSSLICMVACTLVNLRWKISVHVAGSGLLTGGLIAYSLLFLFNPVWYLSIAILLAGMLGSARMIVRLHTLSEVLSGFVVGFLCGIVGILFI